MIEEDVLLADGLEDAFLGVVDPWWNNVGRVAVYDRDKCIDIFVTRDGMTHGEAEEFFEFNVIGACVGPKTPLFLTRDCFDAG